MRKKEQSLLKQQTNSKTELLRQQHQLRANQKKGKHSVHCTPSGFSVSTRAWEPAAILNLVISTKVSIRLNSRISWRGWYNNEGSDFQLPRQTGVLTPDVVDYKPCSTQHHATWIEARKSPKTIQSISVYVHLLATLRPNYRARLWSVPGILHQPKKWVQVSRCRIQIQIFLCNVS